VAWVAPRGPDQGYAQVLVDGRLAATVNLRAESAGAPGVVWRTAWPTSGWHTIRIRVLGTVGRPAVAVDALTVLR
jgi:hypothetical protein